MTETNTPTKKITPQIMAVIGLMTAVTCILGPLSLPLPFSPVPISLTALAIYLALYTLGMKWGTLSVILYILLGLAGLPVFSAFSAGPAKLFGPTGGYIVGFIFLGLIAGYFLDHWAGNLLLNFLGLFLGISVCYMFGTAWLAYQASLTFPAALMAGVIPFIPGDLAKIVIAMIVGPQLRKALYNAGLRQ